jgi:hypothetical protein
MRRDVRAAPSPQSAGPVQIPLLRPPQSLRSDGPVQIPVLQAPLTLPGGSAGRFAARERSFSRAELTLLAVFSLISLWVIGADLLQVVAHDRVWTGTDGVYTADQMQYLAWIVSASRTGLIADLFVLRPTAAVYFQPAVAISGLLVRAGLSPTLALLAWKPVAVIGVFLAVRTFAMRALPGRRGPFLAVLTLTLFYGFFSGFSGGPQVVGDLWPGFLSWGYPWALMAVACMIFALLCYERARASRRSSWAPGLLGALAGLLHPWQGELLVLVVVGTELLEGVPLRGPRRRLRRSPRLSLAARTLLLSGLPLLYYYALGKLNWNWQLGQAAAKHSYAVTPVVLALGPLALVALLGYRGRSRSFLERAVRVWPAAAVLIYLEGYTSQGATPLHAFDGITLPLSMLAVCGALRAGWRRLPAQRTVAIAVIGLFTIPATVWELRLAARQAAPQPTNPNFIAAGERRALSYLRRDPVRGGVLTSGYLGMTIPGLTGRRTFDGDCIWSEPDCLGREDVMHAFVFGTLTGSAARRVALATPARFVLTPCYAATARITRELAPITRWRRSFGCATVYRIRRPAIREQSRRAAGSVAGDLPGSAP